MLYPVTKSELHRVWEVVTPYLMLAFKRSPIPIPLDGVYEEIEAGHMKLFILTDEKKIWGATILQPQVQVGVKILNIFAVSHKPGYKRTLEDLQQAEDIAKEMGCEYLIGYGRRGFTKTSVPWGFKYAQAIMARKVG